MTHDATDPIAKLRDQLAAQGGVASVSQLDEAGITDHQRRALRDRGLLDKVGAHTYRAGLVEPTRRDDLAALVHDCGPDAWASGPTAAALHGFDGFHLARPFHITVLRGRNVARAGVIVHATTAMPLIDRDRIGGTPVTRAARTIVDLGATSSVGQLTMAIDSMIRDGRGSEDLLHRRIVALRGSGRRGIRKVIAALDGADARRGGHSYLERRFLEIVAAAGLPRPDTQVWAVDGAPVRVDCCWPAARVVVELLGHRWHRTKRQVTVDAERQRVLTLDGWRVYAFTYEEVVGRPDAVAATVRAALA